MSGAISSEPQSNGGGADDGWQTIDHSAKRKERAAKKAAEDAGKDNASDGEAEE